MPRPMTGGYYWFPTQAGDTVEWSVLTCHDLGFGAEEGHVDMWPSVIDRLATAWGRDPVRLERLLARHCYGLPRGRVTRSGAKFLINHGKDSPVDGWEALIVKRFHLAGRRFRAAFDDHERMLTEDSRAVSEVLGIPPA